MKPVTDAEVKQLLARDGDDVVSFGAKLALGSRLARLAEEHGEWSQRTFGSDEQRGPVGALRHLEREAREAAESPGDHSEYADCLLLILDASRRAGLDVVSLVEAARAKMEVNKKRSWPEPGSVPDGQPAEHLKGEAK